MLTALKKIVDLGKRLFRAVVDLWHDVERKVKAASLLALLATMAMEVLDDVHDTGALLDALPPQVAFVVRAAIPAVVVFLGAYATRHTPRDTD